MQAMNECGGSHGWIHSQYRRYIYESQRNKDTRAGDVRLDEGWRRNGQDLCGCYLALVRLSTNSFLCRFVLIQFIAATDLMLTENQAKSI